MTQDHRNLPNFSSKVGEASAIDDTQMTDKKIKVLIIDDAKMFLYGIEALLRMEPDITILSTAETGAQAVRRAVDLRPDVVLVDLRIKWLENDPHPEITSGIRTIRELLQQIPDLAILVITSFAEKRWLVQAMDAGATGLLAKECEPYEIVIAIREVYRGRTVLTGEQLRWLREIQGLLTTREKEVLKLVIQGLDDQKIANSLRVKTSTVRKHVENLRTKLHARNRLEIVIYTMQKGLV